MSGLFGRQKLDVYENAPLGSVVVSALALDKLVKDRNGRTKYLALNGKDRYRSEVDNSIRAQLANGIFTPTARTLNASPYDAGAGLWNSAAVDSTNFLVAGAAGTSALQASPTGASWSTSATWSASTGVTNIVNTGVRFIIAGSGGDMSAPYVATIDQTAANIVAKSNWTATTGGASTTCGRGLAYNPSLAMAILIPNTAGTAAYTLADGATAWTTRTLPTNLTKKNVVNTGKRFLIQNANGSAYPFTYTEDGANYTDLWSPINNFFTGAYNLVSDGKGTVVTLLASGTTPGGLIAVSHDHGDNWFQVMLPTESTSTPAELTFVNDLFVIKMNGGVLYFFSRDGETWFADFVEQRGIGSTLLGVGWVYKTGVYLIYGSSTSAATLTEDRSKFRIPRVWRCTTDLFNRGSNWQEYLKVLP